MTEFRLRKCSGEKATRMAIKFRKYDSSTVRLNLKILSINNVMKAMLL